MTSPLRLRIQRGSTPILRAVSAAPKWAVFLVVLVLIVGGLLSTGWRGALLLGVLGVALAWLSYLAWPASATGRRVLQLLTIGLIGFAAVLRVTGS